MDSGGLELSTLTKHMQAVEVGPLHSRELIPSEGMCQEGNLGCSKSYSQMDNCLQ